MTRDSETLVAGKNLVAAIYQQPSKERQMCENQRVVVVCPFKSHHNNNLKRTRTNCHHVIYNLESSTLVSTCLIFFQPTHSSSSTPVSHSDQIIILK